MSLIQLLECTQRTLHVTKIFNLTYGAIRSKKTDVCRCQAVWGTLRHFPDQTIPDLNIS